MFLVIFQHDIFAPLIILRCSNQFLIKKKVSDDCNGHERQMPSLTFVVR
ncbi:hypothetical protein A671_00921 [Salmonella enterica subsp. enterica serovar Dublin str. DG22]|uniref:Uncharacterized protein n=1 Tax=Salmonella enterica subsp. enterica serovar Dublin str. UC16 TaxID=1192688 RepID=M7RRW2_SALDU|nr:hypothetical protein A670_00140 [Salmonella enterica subsp. enterica serovar Dublin str. UC16]EPI74269.1 hypothetical protein A671_00921 [Salmonella enterica subsp. enterica serovar Dublin str. DG22]